MFLLLRILNFRSKIFITSLKEVTESLNSSNKKDTKERENNDSIVPVQRLDGENIKKLFPILHNELIVEKGLGIDSIEVRTAIEEEEANISETLKEIPDISLNHLDSPVKLQKDYLHDFSPQVHDFIRRASTETEVLEVFSYLLDNKELSNEEADALRSDLKNLGVVKLIEKLGGFKKHGHYFNYQDKKHIEEKLKLTRKKPT